MPGELGQWRQPRGRAHLLLGAGHKIKVKAGQVDAQAWWNLADAEHSVGVCLGVAEVTEVLVVASQGVGGDECLQRV
jgi:hypothetical protein